MASLGKTVIAAAAIGHLQQDKQ